MGTKYKGKLLKKKTNILFAKVYSNKLTKKRFIFFQVSEYLTLVEKHFTDVAVGY